MIDFEAAQLNSLHILLATFSHKSRLCQNVSIYKQLFILHLHSNLPSALGEYFLLNS